MIYSSAENERGEDFVSQTEGIAVHCSAPIEKLFVSGWKWLLCFCLDRIAVIRL